MTFNDQDIEKCAALIRAIDYLIDTEFEAFTVAETQRIATILNARIEGGSDTLERFIHWRAIEHAQRNEICTRLAELDPDGALEMSTAADERTAEQITKDIIAQLQQNNGGGSQLA